MQNDPKISQDLMSIGDASKYLNVSIDTLRRWEKKGKAKTYRSQGGHRYFSRNELDALVGKRYKRFAHNTNGNPDNVLPSDQPPAKTQQHPDPTLHATLPHAHEPPTFPDTAKDIPSETPPDNTGSFPITQNGLTFHNVDSFKEFSADDKELDEDGQHNFEEKEHMDFHSQHLTPTSVLDNIPLQKPVADTETITTQAIPKPVDIEVYEMVKRNTGETDLNKKKFLLRSVVEEKQADSLTKLQQFVFGAFIAFLIIDIILLIIWKMTG